MAATRDKTQKIAFVYSNLYQIYKTQKEAPRSEVPAAPAAAPVAIQAGVAPVAAKSVVIKADDLRSPGAAKVSEFAPADFIGKRVPKPEVLVRAENNAALDSLRKNLNDLNELHNRLKFMLKELEELVKE